MLAIVLGCTGPKKAVTTSNKLNGTWIPVKQEIGGKELPEAVYGKQQLIIADSNYTFTAESIDKGIVKWLVEILDDTEDPTVGIATILTMVKRKYS